MWVWATPTVFPVAVEGKAHALLPVPVHGQTNPVEHLGWWPLNAIGSTMGAAAESYKKQSLARKQGSVDEIIDFIKLSL